MSSNPSLGSAHPTTSESEEMYLITVARSVEEGRRGPLPMADLAADLGVSVASANEMVRKLAARGLLTYEPYHGINLTPDGSTIADRVLRIRRLWSTFLVTHLEFSPTDADDQACDLEHVTTSDAAERLSAFLGNPEAGPLGRPIPTGAPRAPQRRLRLTELGAGDRAEVIAMTCGETATRFLATEGIVAGSPFTVTARGGSGLLLDLEHGPLHVDDLLAADIEVRLR